MHFGKKRDAPTAETWIIGGVLKSLADEAAKD